MKLVATISASEVSKSMFAGITAKIIAFLFEIYSKTKDSISSPIFSGWSPVGIWKQSKNNLPKSKRCLKNKTKLQINIFYKYFEVIIIIWDITQN